MLDLLQVKTLSQQDEKRRVTAQMRPNTLFRTFGMRIKNSGFTLIEILIVVMIIAIAAMIAVPMMTSAASVQIRSAANLIAADLEYAKSMAIGKGMDFAVVFDKENESYQLFKVKDEDGSLEMIENPLTKELYEVKFSSDVRLDKVDIVDVDFDGTEKIRFDYMGNPKIGEDTYLQAQGVINLHAGGTNITIKVEPVTGFILISD